MKGQILNHLRFSKSYYQIKVNSGDVYRDDNLVLSAWLQHANNNSSRNGYGIFNFELCTGYGVSKLNL